MRFNGNVGRTSKEIKAAIRKYAAHYTGSLFPWLPEVLLGLKTVLAQSHLLVLFYTSYIQKPLLPSKTKKVHHLLYLTLVSTEDEEPKCTEELASVFWELKCSVVEQLKKAGDLQKETAGQPPCWTWTLSLVY